MDTKRALVSHKPDGERYIIEYEPIWNEHETISGSRVIAAAGPIYYGDLQPDGGPLMPSKELFDRIDVWELTDEDAGWLQDEDNAGNLDYPIGVR